MRIDENVPIPKIVYRISVVYGCLDTMVVGESCLFQNKSSGDISSALSRHSKRNGFKYTQRKVIEDGIVGQRVWRIR